MKIPTRRQKDTPEVVRLKLLSDFRLSVESRIRMEDAFRLRKAANLVKLLPLILGHRLYRQRASDLLWHRIEEEAKA
jgi:hypothetical protein